MKANIMYAAGDVRVEEIPVPQLQKPTDAILKVVVACICGSDLHPYHNMHAHEHGEGEAMGHEVIGRIEEMGSEVSGFKKGYLVIVPFAVGDNTCPFKCGNGRLRGAGFGRDH
ncbi:alcohol dehydrogenase catalytic domain-containing protein [Paenibacillus sp. BR2-3]|uniref:alcohol dehydrogenase catalytic domain-containing protein n=1 Tax=Paenibacillus sp. BR2-3 TaxID=3048494 RepID=UPI0039774A6F